MRIDQSNVVARRKSIFSVIGNSHTIIESLPTSTTLIVDSNSNREEINIFSGPDDSILPGIESDFDSEEDIIDNLLNDDPIPEYERLTLDMETDVLVINNVNEDECFDPVGGEINVEVDDSFTFVTRTFLPYLTYPEVSPILSSTKNEDIIFDPGISHLAPGGTHRDGNFMYGYSKNRKKTVKTGQTRTRDGKECTRAEDLIARKVKSHLQSTLGQQKLTH
ncbi:hypothetical protein Tco_0260342 [Tanacetum coccineum]